MTYQSVFGGGLYSSNSVWKNSGWYDDMAVGIRSGAFVVSLLCILLLLFYLFVEVPKGFALGVGIALVASLGVIEFSDYYLCNRS